MKLSDSLDRSVCPMLATLAVIGGKWKPAILWHLRRGVFRFGALQRSVGAITQKMLTQQLRELEADGIVVRTIFAEVPPRVEYRMTDYGRTLEPVIDLMAQWGARHRAHAAKVSPRARCSSPPRSEHHRAGSPATADHRTMALSQVRSRLLQRCAGF
jgi:DNA-binding HxlR family transcriptional regulator